MAIIVSSSTSSPRSIFSFARSATGLRSRTASRRMSPVETLSSPRSRANRPACVPFPAPGGPIMMTFKPTQDSSSPRRGGGERVQPRRPRIRVFFMNPS
jgi:hypothetical protein